MHFNSNLKVINIAGRIRKAYLYNRDVMVTYNKVHIKFNDLMAKNEIIFGVRYAIDK